MRDLRAPDQNAYTAGRSCTECNSSGTKQQNKVKLKHLHCTLLPQVFFPSFIDSKARRNKISRDTCIFGATGFEINSMRKLVKLNSYLEPFGDLTINPPT